MLQSAPIQSSAPLLDSGIRDSRRIGELKAAEILAHLRYWASVCPDYRSALDDCSEELAWSARVDARTAGAEFTPSELKHGANQIVTTLSLWAELYQKYESILLACVEEIETISAARRKKDDSARARDIVLEALTIGYQTSTQITDFTGLQARRVRRALVRLVQLGLVRVVGCGARTKTDGNRTRLYELVHTPA